MAQLEYVAVMTSGEPQATRSTRAYLHAHATETKYPRPWESAGSSRRRMACRESACEYTSTCEPVNIAKHHVRSETKSLLWARINIVKVVKKCTIFQKCLRIDSCNRHDALLVSRRRVVGRPSFPIRIAGPRLPGRPSEFLPDSTTSRCSPGDT